MPDMSFERLKRLYASTDNVVDKCAVVAASRKWRMAEQPDEVMLWLWSILFDEKEDKLVREQAIWVLSAFGADFGRYHSLASTPLREYLKKRETEGAMADACRNSLRMYFGITIEEDEGAEQ